MPGRNNEAANGRFYLFKGCQGEALFERTGRSNLRSYLRVVRRWRWYDDNVTVVPSRRCSLDDVCGAYRPLVCGDRHHRRPHEENHAVVFCTTQRPLIE